MKEETEAEIPQEMQALPLLPLENGYYYQQLSAEEKTVYEMMYRTFRRCASEVLPEAGVKDAVLDQVFPCVLGDHPELFYVDGFRVISRKEDGRIVKKTFSGSYLYDTQEIAKRAEALERAVQKIVGEGTEGMSEYEKVRYVYEYLVTNTEYVQNASDNQNICSVLLGGASVCQGYAKAMQYLLERMGVRTLLVTGTVDGREEHAWNLVRIDGAYYHVDVTWGDASYINSNSDTQKSADAGSTAKEPRINYEYLCVPDEQLFRTHQLNSALPLPKCVSMKANYYVMEGLYFEDADMERVKGLFEQAHEAKKAYVTLKCADGQTYEELKDGLIEKQRIFRYLPDLDTGIAYTANEQQLTLSFWLQD